MFIHYRTQGFIIKKNDTGEGDRIFTVYTKDFGKLELMAKAVRKIKSKLRAGLEIFYLSEIEFIQGKVYKTLTDAILIDNFKNLRKDLAKMVVACRISEVFDKSVRGQEADEKLWHLLTETFQKLNADKPKPETDSLIYYYFVWNFLSLLGYQLELYHCSLCQKKLIPENIYFSPRERGLICAQCQKRDKSKDLVVLFPDTIKTIRVILKKDWSTLKRLKIESKNFDLLKIISNRCLVETLKQIE